MALTADFCCLYLTGQAMSGAGGKYRRADLVKAGDTPPVSVEAKTTTGWTVGTQAGWYFPNGGTQVFNRRMEGGVERAVSTWESMTVSPPFFDAYFEKTPLTDSYGNAFVCGPFANDVIIEAGAFAETLRPVGIHHSGSLMMSADTNASGQDMQIQMLSDWTNAQGQGGTQSGSIVFNSYWNGIYASNLLSTTPFNALDTYGITPNTTTIQYTDIIPAGAYIHLRFSCTAQTQTPATNTRADLLFVEGPNTYLSLGVVHVNPMYNGWYSRPIYGGVCTVTVTDREWLDAAPMQAQASITGTLASVQPQANFSTTISAAASVQATLAIPKDVAATVVSSAAISATIAASKPIAALCGVSAEFGADLETQIALASSQYSESLLAGLLDTQIMAAARMESVASFIADLRTEIIAGSEMAASGAMQAALFSEVRLASEIHGYAQCATPSLETEIRLSGAMSSYATVFAVAEAGSVCGSEIITASSSNSACVASSKRYVVSTLKGE